MGLPKDEQGRLRLPRNKKEEREVGISRKAAKRALKALRGDVGYLKTKEQNDKQVKREDAAYYEQFPEEKEKAIKKEVALARARKLEKLAGELFMETAKDHRVNKWNWLEELDAETSLKIRGLLNTVLWDCYLIGEHVVPAVRKLDKIIGQETKIAGIM